MESSMALTNARRPNARRARSAVAMRSVYHQKTMSLSPSSSAADASGNRHHRLPVVPLVPSTGTRSVQPRRRAADTSF